MSTDIWYRARCHWYDRKTGASGVYTETGRGSLWPDDESPQGISVFMWDEGNYSCDHNRMPFFIDEEAASCCDWNDEFRMVITKLEALSSSGEVLATWEPFDKDNS